MSPRYPAGIRDNRGALIAILADTHLPKGARRPPDRCAELLAAAELAIHAGDFFAASAREEVVRPACLTTLREICQVGPSDSRAEQARSV